LERLFEAEEHVLDGKKLEIKRAIPREEIEVRREAMSEETREKNMERRTSKIFIGGLTLDSTKEDLEDHFRSFGTIVEASIMVDHETSRSRGFGFVTFDSEEAVDRLLEEIHEIRGKKVDCKKAVPREETSSLPPPKSRSIAPRPPMPSDRRNSYDDRRRPSLDYRDGFDRRFETRYEDRRGREYERGYRERERDERFGFLPFVPPPPPKSALASPFGGFGTQAPFYAPYAQAPAFPPNYAAYLAAAAAASPFANPANSAAFASSFAAAVANPAYSATRLASGRDARSYRPY